LLPTRCSLPLIWGGCASLPLAGVSNPCELLLIRVGYELVGSALVFYTGVLEKAGT